MMKPPASNFFSMNLPGSAAMQHYLREIQSVPLLNAHDEKRLARLVAQGDPVARDLMIKANLRLVVNLSRHYLGRGLCLEDLIEEGNLGLMRAVESYDPDASTRFSTYAVYWIKQSMRRAVMNQGRAVRLPAYLVNLLSKWHRASAFLTDKLGRVPTENEVADTLKLSKRKRKLAILALEVNRAMPTAQDTTNSPERSLEELVSDARSLSVDDQVHTTDCLQRIYRNIDLLDDMEAEVIRLRFGLEGEKALSLLEVANTLGITRERVRLIERRGMSRLTQLCRQR